MAMRPCGADTGLAFDLTEAATRLVALSLNIAAGQTRVHTLVNGGPQTCADRITVRNTFITLTLEAG